MPDALRTAIWMDDGDLCLWVASPSWKRDLVERVTLGVLVG